MGSRYLDPKTDITFKRIFGTQRNEDITIGFLNAILDLQGQDVITEVTMLDANNHPELFDKRRSIVDVRCSDKKGAQYIIEMQIVDKKNFVERCQYYVAKTIADQLDATQDFKKLKPVIFIGVLADFSIDPVDDFLCHHTIRNVKTNTQILKHMDFYFLQLPKFNLTEEQLITSVDHWAFMLKNAPEVNALPAQIQKDKPVNHAFNELDRVGWTQEDLDAYRLSIEILHENKNAQKNWLEAGRAEGRNEGRVEGLEIGEQKGRNARSLEIARTMLAEGLSIDMVEKVTGLSCDVIKKLR